MNAIRNAAKAIILRDDTVLMIRCTDSEGDFYILPGGGQEVEELMQDTVVRECTEEIGCPVQVGPLLYVCEYVGPKAKDWVRSTHQIEFMFRCTLPHGVEPKAGEAPDDIQTGVEWVAFDRLSDLRHYPEGLVQALRETGSMPAYWGNVKS